MKGTILKKLNDIQENAWYIHYLTTQIQMKIKDGENVKEQKIVKELEESIKFFGELCTK